MGPPAVAAAGLGVVDGLAAADGVVDAAVADGTAVPAGAEVVPPQTAVAPL